MSIVDFKLCYELKEFFEEDNNKVVKDKECKMMIAKDHINKKNNIVKCFYSFNDYINGEKFYKKEKNLYEILYKDKRKIYLDIDKIEYKKEEFEKWINNLIEILNVELKIETKMEDYLIFVDNREVIKSCHITMRNYSMHYLKQKKLNMILKKKYEIKTDITVYSKNQFFRFLKHSKLEKNKKLINYKKVKVDFIEMLINETDKTKELDYETYVKEQPINEKKNLKKNELLNDCVYLEDIKKENDVLNEFINKCYNKERAEDYTSWRNVAFALKNAYNNDYGINVLIRFSMLCPEKYNEEKVINYWNNIKSMKEIEKGYNIDHLYKWARLDNRKMYNNILESDVFYKDIIDKINHSDIPRYIKKLEPNKFIWTKNELYCYDGKKWNKNNLEFGRFICENLYEHLLDLISSYKIEDKEFSKIKKSLNKLKDADFKRKVIETSKEVFTNDKIEFDMKGYLLGFDNGVYDLQNDEFRDFQYDDYITFTVGYNYKKDYDKTKMNELKELIKSIMPTEENRKLYLEILATGLEGRTVERFIMFNGIGSNGKGLIDNFVCDVLGTDYTYQDCPASLLTEKQSSNANPAKFKLNKKRLVFIKEPEEKAPFQNSIIKEITGENKISGRNLHSNDSNINLHLTFICECNAKPPLSSEPTNAERRRFIDLLFPNEFSFDEEKINNINCFKANDKYKRKEWKEENKYELLHLLLENYRDYRNRNNNFIIPNEVKNRTDEYLEKSFTLLPFFNENYEYIEDSKEYLKIEDIILSYRASEDYVNLTKNEKRKLNKAYFINFFSTNYKFSKYFNEYGCPFITSTKYFKLH